VTEGDQTIAVGDGLVDGSGECADIEGIKQDCGIASGLGERADLSGGNGCTRSERLQHGEAGPLMQRRNGDSGRMLVQAP
jgi:hypothetical protein